MNKYLKKMINIENIKVINDIKNIDDDTESFMLEFAEHMMPSDCSTFLSMSGCPDGTKDLIIRSDNPGLQTLIWMYNRNHINNDDLSYLKLLCSKNSLGRLYIKFIYHLSKNSLKTV